jgi:hypothetical protein
VIEYIGDLRRVGSPIPESPAQRSHAGELVKMDVADPGHRAGGQNRRRDQFIISEKATKRIWSVGVGLCRVHR